MDYPLSHEDVIVDNSVEVLITQLKDYVMSTNIPCGYNLPKPMPTPEQIEMFMDLLLEQEVKLLREQFSNYLISTPLENLLCEDDFPEPMPTPEQTEMFIDFIKKAST